MALTRFKDARTGKDGPVSGAICMIPATWNTLLASETVAFSWSPPAGMQFDVLDVSVQAAAVGSDPVLTVGTAKAGTQIVGPVNITTNLGSVTVKTANTVTAGDTLDIRIVCDAGDTAINPSIMVTGFVSAPPTSATVRGIDHF